MHKITPFLLGRAQSSPSLSPAAAPLQCYQCQASRSTYKLPPLLGGVSMAAPQPPTSSTDNTTTTTTTAASTTLTPALQDESNKSPTNDPCWDDSFNGNGDSVIQQNCTDGAVCFKRLVRNSPAGGKLLSFPIAALSFLRSYAHGQDEP
ncbi:hypothetical protein RvY_04138 [Ramazzottius varieornatus]|uniref:Uncharacterized protein n=1 Tax=Ramazzottius varieornatus TaxID=947166 RepID=A0A1D1UU48_RAMVA|nr:hypothetical protein RvY_04138 [Ramazzottius varieornatus]